MAARRRWVPIVIGVGILLVFAGVGVGVFVISYLRQQVSIEGASPASADEAFDDVRRQFAGRAPLVDWQDGRLVYHKDASPAADRGSRRLETFHVLVFDPDDGRLVRVSLPFWILRMKSGPIEFSGYAAGFDEGGVNLRPDDIERYGPGIIIDVTSPTAERVLFWVD
ncbi:MAG: hypothetical protein AB1635_12650 [Acidobacteriota bacterium]